MDDIDVGVKSIPAAKSVIRDIDLTLQSRQLRLNASKTKILDVESGEAADHFCIRENMFLDRCVDIVGDGQSNRRNEIVSRAIGRVYKLWAAPSVVEGRFGRGNGPKIFKYLCKISKEVDFSVPEADLVRLIRLQPSLRDVAFDALSWRDKPNLAFYEIARYFHGGLFVDDVCHLQLANFLIHARFRANAKMMEEVNSIIDLFIDKGTRFSLYAAFLIQSKMLDADIIFKNFEKTFDSWRRDYWLGRAVGGTIPRFFDAGVAEKEYTRLINCASSTFVDDVTKFHTAMVTRKSECLRIKLYASSQNWSFPQGIIHPKALIILTLSKNKDFSAEFNQVKKSQKALALDPFYRVWFK